MVHLVLAASAAGRGGLSLAIADGTLLHRPGLRRLTVHAKRGEVTLSGQVATFHERQLALCHGRRVDGVVNLVDRIDVSR